MSKLYGIGVGPGDPELITLKAIKAINSANVILLPAKDRDKCYAYQIARSVVDDLDSKRIIAVEFPMTKDRAALDLAHETIYQKVYESLLAGDTIAFLTIGDPSIYSTYCYIQKRAKANGLTCETISGVPSFCAAAGALGISLVEEEECLHVIPRAQNIENALALDGTKVFMKSGKALEELKAVLTSEQYAALNVYGVSNCGMPNEKLFFGVENLDEAAGYLTLVIVK